MHFFCELHSELEEESSFGPVAGSETTKFNITSKFKLNGSSTSFKAFACQKGMMIIQNSLDTNRVNVIIKPSESLEINSSPVKYYIYRGLLKNSILSSNNIIPKTTSNKSEFLTRFWEKWDEYLIDNGLQDSASDDPNYATPPTPNAIGYNESLNDTENVEALFDNNHSSGLISTSVLAGEWIGDFGSTNVSIEIITDTEHFYKTYNSGIDKLEYNGLNLEYLRKKEHHVEISPALLSNTSVSGKLYQRLLKEEILSYMDPSAFYGMHSSLKKGIKAYIGGSMEKRKKTQIYDDILALSFNTNKNKVYLDVRSELGYSYNFHQNYNILNPSPLAFGDQIQYKSSTDTSFTNSIYEMSGWPLFYIDSTLGSKKRNKLDLKLRIDDNEKPLLYIEGDTLERDSQFIEVRDTADTNWSKPIRIEFPNVGSGSSKVNIAQHIKIHYFRQENKNPSTGLVFPFKSILDSVFAPIDLPFSAGNILSFSKVDSAKFSIVQNDTFAYLSKPAIYKEGTFYTFFTSVNIRHKASKEVYPVIPDESRGNGSDFNNTPTFPRKMVINKIEIQGTPNYFQMDLALYGNEELPSYKEDVFMLSITEAELNSLRTVADLEGLIPNQPRRIVFTNRTKNTSSNGVNYVSYAVQVQGLKIDNTIHTTTSATLTVYTTNEKTFNSKDFGDAKNLPITPPDSGTMGIWAHVGVKDYSPNDIQVTSVSNSGLISVKDYDTIGTEFEEYVALTGRIYFPTDSPTSQVLSNVLPDYPFILIIHGNGHYYENYDIIGNYLAKNGFIVSSINVGRLRRAKLDALPSTPPTGSDLADKEITHFFVIRDEQIPYVYSSVTKKVFTIKMVNGDALTDKELPWVETVHFEIASNGFIIIYDFRYGGLGAKGRASVVVPSMAVLKNFFPTQLQNNFALMGHSRGAEAVVYAANSVTSDSTTIAALTSLGLTNLNAVISLAPTDQYPTITRSGDVITTIDRVKMTNSIPYFVIYGSRDYDIFPHFRNKNFTKITGYPNNANGTIAANNANKLNQEEIYVHSGFSIYDRSSGMDKIMAYVKGAMHNGFITSNTPVSGTETSNKVEFDNYINSRAGNFASTNFPNANYSPSEQNDIKNKKLRKEVDQQSYTNALMHAFLRRNLLNENIWEPYISASYIPPSVTIKDVDYQFEKASGNHLVLGASSDKNPITKVIYVNNDSSSPQILRNQLRLNDGEDHSKLITKAVSPHDTSGITFNWKSEDKLRIELSGSDTNASTYTYTSFRISNASLTDDLNDLKVILKDNMGIEKEKTINKIKIGDIRDSVKFAKITVNPISFEHYFYLDANLAPMSTIKIPLLDFTGVDFENLVEIIFWFPNSSSGGFVTIDNIMYTN